MLIKVQSAVLPNLNNWVVVLLKMPLATVSVNNFTQPPPSVSSGAFLPGVGETNIDKHNFEIDIQQNNHSLLLSHLL